MLTSFQNYLLSRLHTKLLKRRATLVMSIVRPDPHRAYRVLDLGGSNGELVLMLKSRGMRGNFTIADIYETLPSAEGIRFINLREGETLPFSNEEFDLVICNSVIEHATLPKAECMSSDMPDEEWNARSWKAQSNFAQEIRRVARSYLVQTPHPTFPIDVHLWLPFTNWFSHKASVHIARVIDRFWIKYSYGVDWNLLSEKEIRILFPGADIVIERWFGFPKSIIAYQICSEEKWS